MKQERMFAIVKKPGGAAEIRLTEKDTKAFGAAIEGKREIIPFPGMPGVCVIFDGEAALNKKKPNFFLPEYEDLIAGTCIIAGISLENGFASLTEAQAEKLEGYLKDNNASGFTGNLEERVRKEYLPVTEENFVYGMLCEVKTKYKNLKVKWISKR